LYFLLFVLGPKNRLQQEVVNILSTTKITICKEEEKRRRIRRKGRSRLDIPRSLSSKSLKEHHSQGKEEVKELLKIHQCLLLNQ
jgi:hypothetical protein